VDAISEEPVFIIRVEVMSTYMATLRSSKIMVLAYELQGVFNLEDHNMSGWKAILMITNNGDDL
jgi:hypothetical protein